MEKKNILLVRIFIFPVFFIYLELVFHLLIYKKLETSFFYAACFAAAAGLCAAAFTFLFKRKANAVIAWVILSSMCLVFCTQLVFQHIFKTYLSIYSVGANGGDILEFWHQALQAILSSLPGISLLMLPLAVFGLLRRFVVKYDRKKWQIPVGVFGGACFLQIICLLSLLLPGKEVHSPYDLYYKDFVQELGVEKLGLITSVRMDIKQVFFGGEEPTDIAFVSLVSPTAGAPELTISTPAITNEPTVSVMPTSVPIDISPNVLPIDFAVLAKKENNKNIKMLHQYFSEAVPTNRNEYTGLLEGYNLIMLTAEGFSPWAVDKEVTPTLYQLTHEGFVFENFYTPIWWTSTSDGEFVAMSGLIPNGTNSFKKTAENAMPFGFGHIFSELGYSSRAYHNNSYKYYHRDQTHRNMGYNYKGAKGGGLEVRETWPESDLEMMQLTIPEFIHDQKFHVYYMTVSGHMEYSFIGNSMSFKNKDYVSGLPYGDAGKAYIACQKELDLALEYLIDQLEKEGIADKTVIVLSADHYPYGLEMKDINELAGHEVDENFELYKNNLIIWNAGMKEPVAVSKYCSSLDMVPTLLNLFGIEYDSRLFPGQDILSEGPALVMFSNQSFITDIAKYNSKTRKAVSIDKKEVTDEYIKLVNSVVRNKFIISENIVKYNYYSYLLPYLKPALEIH